MRLTSHECRWFFSGAPSEDVVARFKTAGNWEVDGSIEDQSWPTEWRDDRYEVLPAGGDPPTVDMGIKLRDERAYGKALRLEYKARTAVLGHVRLAPEVTGVVERWIKWSYKDDEVPESLWSPFDRGDIGTVVYKKRILRKIRLDLYDEDKEVPEKAIVDRGLAFELTRIKLDGDEQHWSFGLEAFPHDPEMHEDFLRNARRFLTDFGKVADLSEQNSMSYPEWLSGVASSAQGSDS